MNDPKIQEFVAGIVQRSQEIQGGPALSLSGAPTSQPPQLSAVASDGPRNHGAFAGFMQGGAMAGFVEGQNFLTHEAFNAALIRYESGHGVRLKKTNGGGRREGWTKITCERCAAYMTYTRPVDPATGVKGVKLLKVSLNHSCEDKAPPTGRARRGTSAVVRVHETRCSTSNCALMTPLLSPSRSLLRT